MPRETHTEPTWVTMARELGADLERLQGRPPERPAAAPGVHEFARDLCETAGHTAALLVSVEVTAETLAIALAGGAIAPAVRAARVLVAVADCILDDEGATREHNM